MAITSGEHIALSFLISTPTHKQTDSVKSKDPYGFPIASWVKLCLLRVTTT